MEPENHKIIRGFLSPDERNLILEWVSQISHTPDPKNPHISFVRSGLNGNSYMIDIAKTEPTQYVCDFQSGHDVMIVDTPPIFLSLAQKISTTVGIPLLNCFVQIIDMSPGGIIKPHYDSTFSGMCNYKCNISVISEDYIFSTDKKKMEISQGDLYCFEASLYKHWSEREFSKKRVLLSFGFLLPYSVLGWNLDDPRVRLSERIQKKFQKPDKTRMSCKK